MNPAASYIMGQDEPYRSILLHLQSVIERQVPGAVLQFKWKVPFYYVDGKPFCYLNRSHDYVDLGFWNAVHLTSHPHHLVSDGRKVMRSLRYFTLESIDEKVIKDLLAEALQVRHKGFWNS